VAGRSTRFFIETGILSQRAVKNELDNVKPACRECLTRAVCRGEAMANCGKGSMDGQRELVPIKKYV
jgi:hypothetical protein